MIFEYDDSYYEKLALRAKKIIEDLYPINRSLTGLGVRQTLYYLDRFFHINIYDIPTGTDCFGWTIPNEWNLRSARLIDPDGNTIISTDETNLCVVGHSIPVSIKLDLDQLLPHLHSDPDRPDVVPYRTSYYKEDWGFCIPHSVKQNLKPGKYKAIIDTELKPGYLNYGDFIIGGKSRDEVMLSTYVCHPSMVNDNLSGIALTTIILEELSKHREELNLTYRGIFAPETLGSIAYLKNNGNEMRENVKAGFVVTCVADGAERAVYKRSRQGNSLTDRAVEYVAEENGKIDILDFWPSGSDERQYCSPGFDLPVGSLMRTPYCVFPEYHSSADDLSIISLSGIAEMIKMYMRVISVIEINGKWIRKDGGFCEPRLGEIGLYPNNGGHPDNRKHAQKILWLLNLADGKHDLISIAKRSGYSVFELAKEITVLEDNNLIERLL